MTKISKKEYEILKSLDDQWKWIARDEKETYESFYSNQVMAYRTRPNKHNWLNIWSDGSGGKRLPEELFQFIRWEDREPCRIAELIEGYEYSADHVSHVVNERVKALGKAWSESEETEMKSKQELIEKWESAIESAEFYGKGKEEELISYIKDFVSDLKQLDEPEVLSQEWIDEHAKAVAYDGMPDETEIVYVDDLQNLLVPKQEEVDRAYKDGEPETVADVVTTFWKSYERLKEVMGIEVEELEE